MPSNANVTLTNPLDMHLHLRDGDMLRTVAPLSAQSFSGAIVMPNLVPPVTTKADVRAYRERILQAIGEATFKPYMTLFFKSDYDYDFLADVRDDITAIKLYPAGITTNSEGGVTGFDIDTLRPTLEAMRELDIPLCVHGETGGFVMDREKEFASIYAALAEAFPKLTIVMEHIRQSQRGVAGALRQSFRHHNASSSLHHARRCCRRYVTAASFLQTHSQTSRR